MCIRDRVGAASAASFYAPIEKVKKWSWETTWAVAGLFSWILLPIGVSLFLLPDFRGFYASIGVAVLLLSLIHICKCTLARFVQGRRFLMLAST